MTDKTSNILLFFSIMITYVAMHMLFLFLNVEVSLMITNPIYMYMYTYFPWIDIAFNHGWSYIYAFGGSRPHQGWIRFQNSY